MKVGIEYYKSIISLTIDLLMRDKIQKINELLNKI